MFINVPKVFKSFIPATKGIGAAFGERNMRVHGIAVAVVVPLGFLVGLNKNEWITIIMLMAMVLSAEMVNTAIEELCNICRDEMKLSYNATRRARDVAAGAVLIFAITAVVVGGMIFIPKFMNFLG